MTAEEALDEARRRGVRVRAAGPKLRWRCRGPLPDDLRDLLAAHKPALLAVLARTGPCPQCRRDRDESGRCWSCFDRPCASCGRPTGSAFIAHCIQCGSQVDAPPECATD